MADELTIEAFLSFVKNGCSPDPASFARATFDVAGTNRIHQIQTIPTTASGTALSLGTSIGTLGYGFFVNRDATNFVELMTAVGGSKIIRLRAGECALFRFGQGVTAPAAIADTGSCDLEYWIIEA